MIALNPKPSTKGLMFDLARELSKVIPALQKAYFLLFPTYYHLPEVTLVTLGTHCVYQLSQTYQPLYKCCKFNSDLLQLTGVKYMVRLNNPAVSFYQCRLTRPLPPLYLALPET